jgi:4,5-dihydroxyphthalate decarboxylase
MTANVWVRGILQDEYGVKPSDIKWRRGGLEEAGREERAKIKLPPEIELIQVADDRTLSQMLAAGEIDGLVSARAPSCFLEGSPNVGRLFPNYPEVEAAYFKKTGIFPIMHAIGIRRSLVETHPWLAVSVYKAFLKAKQIAMAELGQIGHLAVSLPWCVADYERARGALGPDYWSYGAPENRHVLEKLAQYSFEQGLSVRKLPFLEMFAPSTYDLTKI